MKYTFSPNKLRTKIPGRTAMKRYRILLLCLAMVCIPVFSFAEEEESVVQNRVKAALEAAEHDTQEAAFALTAFDQASPESMERARERGVLLSAAVRSAKGGTTLTLTGDTSMEGAETLTCGNKKPVILNLNGYVLHAPCFDKGAFILRNGVVSDLRGVHESGTLSLTVEESCFLLCLRNSAALELEGAGSFQLINRGIIQGIHRLLYSRARRNRITMVNQGTVFSSTVALSLRSFHQPSIVSIENEGMIAGLHRGLDAHGTAGSLTVTGRGKILGVLGPWLDVPKLELSCGIVADDSGLSKEELRTVLTDADPYGDLGVETGVAYDLLQIKGENWRRWKISGSVWASREILRFSLPLNSRMKGRFTPVPEDRTCFRASCRVTLEKKYAVLTPEAAEKQLDAFWKNFSMDGFFASGGELSIHVLCRTAETEGNSIILFSTADTRWSQMKGRRGADGFSWQASENGILSSQEPVTTFDDWYQLRAALNAAGPGGTVRMDRDAFFPENGDPIDLPEGIRMEGNGFSLYSLPELILHGSATLDGFELQQDSIAVSGTLRSGETLMLSGSVPVNSLILHHAGVKASVPVKSLTVKPRGGKAVFGITVIRRLELDLTENYSGTYRFPRPIGEGESGAEIRITFSQGNLAKVIWLNPGNGVDTIRAMVRSREDPEKAMAIRPENLLQSFAPYLEMIHFDPEASVNPLPTVTFEDEHNQPLAVFSFENGRWKPAF